MICKCCAFTGHRPKKFPWGYDESDPRCIALKQELAAQILKLADAGYTDFLSGMAEGADTWAAPARERYDSILEQADSVLYVSRAYDKGCMLRRNRYPVDHAGCLLAVYNGEQRGGTAMTVRYARKLGRKIVLLDVR